MGSNIKCPWQPGHQCESFHWSIIYTVGGALNKAVSKPHIDSPGNSGDNNVMKLRLPQPLQQGQNGCR